jgi:hypothetical protein
VCAAWRRVSALTLISWKPPHGLHDIGYTADLATTGLHALDGAATCVTPSTPMPCRAGWSHTDLAPSSRPAKADSPTSFLEFEPTPQALSSVLPDGEPEPVEKRSPRNITAPARGTSQ